MREPGSRTPATSHRWRSSCVRSRRHRTRRRLRASGRACARSRACRPRAAPGTVACVAPASIAFATTSAWYAYKPRSPRTAIVSSSRPVRRTMMSDVAPRRPGARARSSTIEPSVPTIASRGRLVDADAGRSWATMPPSNAQRRRCPVVDTGDADVSAAFDARAARRTLGPQDDAGDQSRAAHAVAADVEDPAAAELVGEQP